MSSQLVDVACWPSTGQRLHTTAPASQNDKHRSIRAETHGQNMHVTSTVTTNRARAVFSTGGTKRAGDLWEDY